MYTTKITSQGTITLPAKLRDKHNLHIGETVAITDTGEITISKIAQFSTVREKNRTRISKVVPYKSGDGMHAHVHEKYGK